MFDKIGWAYEIVRPCLKKVSIAMIFFFYVGYVAFIVYLLLDKL